MDNWIKESGVQRNVHERDGSIEVTGGEMKGVPGGGQRMGRDRDTKRANPE